MAADQFKVADEPQPVPDQAEDVSVEEDGVHVRIAHLFTAEHVHVLDAQIERHTDDGLLFYFGRDVRHQGQVLDQTTSFTFRRIRRAHHPPLRRLQRTGAAHLARFFKLRVDAGHHSQSGNVRQTRQHLSHSLTVHLETLNRPISCRDGHLQSLRNVILADVLDHVKLGSFVLGDILVGNLLQLPIHSHEEILEEQRQQRSCQLQTLVAVVIAIVDGRRVALGLDHAPDHQRHVHGLHFEIESLHRNVSQNLRRQ